MVALPLGSPTPPRCCACHRSLLFSLTQLPLLPPSPADNAGTAFRNTLDQHLAVQYSLAVCLASTTPSVILITWGDIGGVLEHSAATAPLHLTTSTPHRCPLPYAA